VVIGPLFLFFHEFVNFASSITKPNYVPLGGASLSYSETWLFSGIVDGAGDTPNLLPTPPLIMGDIP